MVASCCFRDSAGKWVLVIWSTHALITGSPLLISFVLSLLFLSSTMVLPQLLGLLGKVLGMARFSPFGLRRSLLINSGHSTSCFSRSRSYPLALHPV
ncbi:hypothetical protein LINPERHAP1_LOCUS7640 [Linum perenne]